MQRRRDDPNRENFSLEEYNVNKPMLEDDTNFLFRWLTNRTIKEPLGDDVLFVKEYFPHRFLLH